MFRNKNMPINFNGRVFLGSEEYFFNVFGDELRIFYNRTGAASAKEFRELHSGEIERGIIFGECPDKRRIAFFLGGENYSAYPDSYSEFRLSACIKEIFYWLKGSLGRIDKNKKFEYFELFGAINISGKLIDAICTTKDSDHKGTHAYSAKSCRKKETTVVSPVGIRLNVFDQCVFSAYVRRDYGANETQGCAKIQFDFGCDKSFYEFFQAYDSIKRFVDFMAKARNTDCRITLIQNYDGEQIEFAEVRVFNKYKNICDKTAGQVLCLRSVADRIPFIFKNLDDEKYSPVFLPDDNDCYDSINCTDIQNVATAVEIACELDKKYVKVYPRPKNEQIAASKAAIVFRWCEKYVPLVARTQPQNKGWDQPFYYELTSDKIEYFRRVRNDIVHRAYGRIDLETVNCYVALRSILYYRILDLDPDSRLNLHI